MIAKIGNIAKDGEEVTVTVQYLDDSGPERVEVAVRTFRFPKGTVNAQARAEILTAGRDLERDQQEFDRLSEFLAPGTEFAL